MSEQNNTNTTPIFEDVIREKLTGKTQQNALDYVAFVKSIGIQGDGVYYVPGGYLCNIHRVDETGWYVSMEHIDSPLCRSEYQDFPAEQKVKEFAWAHVSTCLNFTTNGEKCGCGFHPGRRVTLFGKEFHHACHGLMNFNNSDGEDLELLKKLTLVWKQCVDDANGKKKPHVPSENEWIPVKLTDANAGRPLGKDYTKKLDVEFYFTTEKKFLNTAIVGFSGGGLISAEWPQFPVALFIGAMHIGPDRNRDRIVAYKGKEEGYTSVETFKYQQNVTYLVEMSINVADNTYSATVWMLDADGRPDTPYCIAKDFPFRLEDGAPLLTAIDTVYPVYVYDGSYIIRDFKIISGE